MQVITLARQVGYPIRDQRKALGLTQAELARRVGVSRQLIVKLELGTATGIALDTLLKVLDVLGLEVAVGTHEELREGIAEHEPEAAERWRGGSYWEHPELGDEYARRYGATVVVDPTWREKARGWRAND